MVALKESVKPDRIACILFTTGTVHAASEYNVNYFGHTGLGDGFASMNIYIPKSDVSIIVLENQMNKNPDLYYYYETIIKKIILKSELVD